MSGYRVLLVEDDADVWELLATAVHVDGVKLEWARSGREALSAAKSERPPELILLDVGLPDVNGFEVLGELKSGDVTASIPVLFLTANDQGADKARAFDLGASDYLTKPFDIMELRARMRALLRTKRLQDALTRSNRELAAARIAAEEAARTKASFLANMSHEIRTPMNGVIAMTGLLQETPLNADQRELVETIRTSGDALLDIINDILDFSKIESGKITLENQEFNLRDCVEDALELLAPKAFEKNLELFYQFSDDVPSRIVGDGCRLRQVLVNLLANGIKFTETGEVSLEVTTDSRSGLLLPNPKEIGLRFTITDTGIGIPAEKIPRLFQSFTQADGSINRLYGGTGLGLAISRKLVELLGGRIGVSSTEGLGSRFSFDIRAGRTLHKAGNCEAEEIARVSGLRVLVADNSNRALASLLAKLHQLGTRTTPARNEVELLKLIGGERRYDVLVLGDNVGGRTVEEWWTKIGEQFSVPPPIVALTGLGTDPTGPDKGTRFVRLTRPVRWSHLARALAAATRTGQSDLPVEPFTTRIDKHLGEKFPLRVLLADDNPVNQRVALKLLSQMGYRADLAGNGREAIDAADNAVYDLIFMDLQMPVIDGLEATRTIREVEDSAGRPPSVIIAMTANAMTGDRERCLDSGMNDYLSKPVYPEKLQGVIQKWGEVILKMRRGADATPAETHSEAAAPENQPAVDLRRLDQMAGGDELEMVELAGLYLEQTRKQLDHLASAMDRSDAGQARSLAHSLAGGSATCGMTRMAALFKEIELHAKRGEIDAAMPLMPDVTKEFERVNETLEREVLSCAPRSEVIPRHP